MIDLTPALTDLETLPRLRPWLKTLPRELDSLLCTEKFGNLPRWENAVDNLPPLSPLTFDFNTGSVRIGTPADITGGELAQLTEGLRELHPWRKGPFDLFGLHLSTEWRSDWKWGRVSPHITPLKGRTVLDVGCGNGYHCWRMHGEGARLVLGIDPNPHLLAQFHVFKRYTENRAVHLLPLRSEDLPKNLETFDTVFSMGVLYHRRSPFDHLLELKSALRPGGELILETLVIPGEAHEVLVPRDRYARMRNVWFLPSAPELERWLERAGFRNVRTVDVNQTSTQEQRTTPWMTYQSLADFLDPTDPDRTVEGYPAPTRAVVVANKPS